jgi:hypothetical protein
MKVNVNHPSFIAFLEDVTTMILSDISVENYFILPQEKKMNVLYTVFTLLMKSSKFKTNLSVNEMKVFITVLWKKNEESENYEIAGILKDISTNFDAIYDFTNKPKKTKRTVRIEKKDE